VLTSRSLSHGLVLLMIAAAPTLALAAEPAATAAGSADLWAPALRMLLSLGAVLGVLAGCVWLVQRLRNGGAFRTGLIEVVSGISLGGREKVVLLRVGGEEILVGISPAGMRPLHVLQSSTRTTDFSTYMDKQS